MPWVLVSWGKYVQRAILTYQALYWKRIPSNSSIMLGPVAISLGCSVMECRVEISIDDHWGATIGLSPGVVLERFTCNMASSLVDSASQIDCLGRGIHSGSKPPFRPSAYTTSLPKWRSLQTSRWLRCLQAFLLGAPSTMMLRCLALERQTCQESSHNHTKA